MSKDRNIFAGGAQVTLYDQTDGQYYFLGYSKEITFIERTKYHKTFESHRRYYASEFSFDGVFLATNQQMIETLYSKRDKRFVIYVVGDSGLLKINNVYVNVSTERGFGTGKPHYFRLFAGFNNPALATWHTNLFTASNVDYRFENFTNGIANGWVVDGYDIVAPTSSFLPGGGDAQLIVFIVGNDYNKFIYNYPFIGLPFKFPIRLTMSAYIKNNYYGNGYRYSARIGLYHTDSTFKFYYDNYRIIPNGERISYSVVCTPLVGKLVKSVYVILNMYYNEGAEIVIDNAQLEIGKLSGFRTD